MAFVFRKPPRRPKRRGRVVHRPPTITLSPALFLDADSFFAPTVHASNTLAPAKFVDGDTFYPATLHATYGLAPVRFDDPDIFFTAKASFRSGLDTHDGRDPGPVKPKDKPARANRGSGLETELPRGRAQIETEGPRTAPQFAAAYAIIHQIERTLSEIQRAAEAPPAAAASPAIGGAAVQPIPAARTPPRFENAPDSSDEDAAIAALLLADRIAPAARRPWSAPHPIAVRQTATASDDEAEITALLMAA
jgi:hypothetical protein